jgi:hypothetical protein
MQIANTKAVTRSGFDTARSNFQNHYFLDQCDTNFDGQDIQIPWNDFADAVDSFIAQARCNPMDVALRFVHCYDATNNYLYLRLQICTMVKQQNSGNVYDLVTTDSEWYQIENGSMNSTTNTDLSDDDYLNNFYYCDAAACSPSTATQLATDGGTLFARNLVFPWGLQIAKLYTDNNSPKGASICFGACSFSNQGAGAAYQHGVVIYLRTEDGTELLNNTVSGAIYDCKGADMATICPPCCNVYIS